MRLFVSELPKVPRRISELDVVAYLQFLQLLTIHTIKANRHLHVVSRVKFQINRLI